MFCCKKKKTTTEKSNRRNKQPTNKSSRRSTDSSRRSSKSGSVSQKSKKDSRKSTRSSKNKKSSKSASRKDRSGSKKSSSKKDAKLKKVENSQKSRKSKQKEISERSKKSKKHLSRIERCFNIDSYEPTHEVYPYLDQLPLKFDEVYLNGSVLNGKQVIEVSLQNEHPSHHNKRHLVVEIRFQKDILFSFYQFTKSKRNIYYKKIVRGSSKIDPYDKFIDWFTGFLNKRKWEVDCFGISRKWGLTEQWPIELFESSILNKCKTIRLLNIGEEKLKKSLSHCKNMNNLELCSGTLSDSFFDQETIVKLRCIHLESVNCSITDDTFARLNANKIFFHGRYPNLTEVAVLDLIERWNTGQLNLDSVTLFTTRKTWEKVLETVNQMTESKRWCDDGPRFNKMLGDPAKWLPPFNMTYQINQRNSDDTCILFVLKNAVHLFFGKWTDSTRTKMTPQILKSELYSHKICSDPIKHDSQ